MAEAKHDSKTASALSIMHRKYGFSGDALAMALSFFSMDIVDIVASYSLCGYATKRAYPRCKERASKPFAQSRIAGLTCTANGGVLVCDFHRLRAFDSTFQLETTLAAGKLHHPCATACDLHSGNILVAQAGGVAVLSHNGDFERLVQPTDVTRPLFLAVSGDCYFVFTSSDVHVFDRGWRVLHSWLSADGGCQTHDGFGVSRTGEVLVFSTRTRRIRVFDAAGKFLRSVGKFSKGEGHIGQARGIAFDNFNNVFVCDDQYGRVQVFSEDGSFVTSFPDITVKKPSLLAMGFCPRPTRVSVAGDGRVFVAHHNEIFVYEFAVETCKRCFLILQDCICVP